MFSGSPGECSDDFFFAILRRVVVIFRRIEGPHSLHLQGNQSRLTECFSFFCITEAHSQTNSLTLNMQAVYFPESHNI
jgi:hypothetical protein